jgi:hypothetical protein
VPTLTRHNLRRWLAGKAPAAALLMGDGVASDATYIHDTYPHIPYVAGYDNGPEEWSDADWALFPDAVHIHIVTSAEINDGDVLDVESQDANPVDAPGWVKLRKGAGYFRPSIYCSFSVVPAVTAACGLAGLQLGVDYDLWVAQWTGSPHEVAGASAVQYKSEASIDFSVVYDKAWPHRSPPAPVYHRYETPGGLTIAQLAAKHGVTTANIIEASEERLDRANKAHFEAIIAGKLLRSMPYWVKK